MQEKKDPKFGLRYELFNLIYVVPAGIAFYFAWENFEEFNLTCKISLLFFLVCVAGAMFDVFRFRRYRCPECGSVIPKRLIEDRRIFYYCSECDIKWDAASLISDD